MPVIQKTREELENIRSIQTLSGVLRDLSITRVQRLREEFQRNIDFYIEVDELFNQVQILVNEYYASTAAEMRKRPKANIAITSNHRFYGSLNQEVMEFFLENWDMADQHIVVGQTGEGYMENDKRYKDCKFISFEDDNPTRMEIQKIVSLAKGFSKALVYYPKYKTPFHQEPAVIDIVRLARKTDMEQSDLSEFIFEPELPIIQDFFSTQVQYVLIQRVMLETDLSRMATRLVRMDTAESYATEMHSKKKRELHDNIQRQLDVQLFESLSGLVKNS